MFNCFPKTLIRIVLDIAERGTNNDGLLYVRIYEICKHACRKMGTPTYVEFLEQLALLCVLSRCLTLTVVREKALVG